MALIYVYGPRLIFVPMKAVTDTPANHGAQFQAIRIPVGHGNAAARGVVGCVRAEAGTS